MCGRCIFTNFIWSKILWQIWQTKIEQHRTNTWYVNLQCDTKINQICAPLWDGEQIFWQKLHIWHCSYLIKMFRAWQCACLIRISQKFNLTSNISASNSNLETEKKKLKINLSLDVLVHSLVSVRSFVGLYGAWIIAVLFLNWLFILPLPLTVAVGKILMTQYSAWMIC